MKKSILNKLVKQSLLELLNENKSSKIKPGFKYKDVKLSKNENKLLLESVNKKSHEKWRLNLLKQLKQFKHKVLIKFLIIP